MRFLTWNIRTGGGDRLDAIARVIGREFPDVVALQELRGFDAHGHRRMRDLADAVGMVAQLAPSLFGQPVAVLVRPPARITATGAVRLWLHHAAAVAVVPTDHGPLTVISTHLNPVSPDRRLREARRLAARYAAADRLVILAGDLNALDPWTDHTDRLARLPEVHRRRHRRRDGSVDTRTIAALDVSGFSDLWRIAGTGDELTAPTTQGGGAEFSGMRLDYVLASPPTARLARALRVVRGDEAEYASDHYPVVADLDLALTGP
jgi:exodeoxyribonuclease-3